jgi:7-cyano-7-deazaguanine synthase
MQRKAFVLLSGGLDSTTCLFKAIMDYMPDDPGISLAYGDKAIWKDVLHDAIAGQVEIPWVEAFSVDYGQRHTKELEYAHSTCLRLGIRHTVLDVGSLLSGKTVMLSRESVGTVAVPDIAYSEIKGVSPTYVPFRNGLMLSAITAQVQKYVNDQIAERAKEIILDHEAAGRTEYVDNGETGMQEATAEAKDLCGIYFGAHSEDAQNWAYPDCTPEFIGSMANAIYIGTYQTIRLHTPLEWLLKADIVKLGDSLGVPFEETWSCYKGEEHHCGTCPTCRSRKEAFQIADVKDPTVYAA